MKAWQSISPAELGAIIQRLYIRLEQYNLHTASLVEGSRAQRSARVQADRLRKRLDDACRALDRQMAEVTGLDAHTLAARRLPGGSRRAGTSGNAGGRAV
jgi:hypothetical protein